MISEIPRHPRLEAARLGEPRLAKGLDAAVKLAEVKGDVAKASQKLDDLMYRLDGFSALLMGQAYIIRAGWAFASGQREVGDGFLECLEEWGLSQEDREILEPYLKETLELRETLK